MLTRGIGTSNRFRRARGAWRSVALGLGIGLGVAAFDAHALDVRGRVVFQRPPEPKTPPAKRDQEQGTKLYYWEEWNGYVQPRAPKVDLAREYVVALCVKQGSVPATSAPSARAPETRVDLWGGVFYPSTVVAPARSKLIVRNQDAFEHVLSAEGRTDLPPMPLSSGGERTLNTGAEGTWVLRDRADANVTAHVHVRQDIVATASLDKQGAFTLPDVPPGAYVLKVFRDGRELVSQVVSVAPKRKKDKRVALDPVDIP
jgi:hypothetical protein